MPQAIPLILSAAINAAALEGFSLILANLAVAAISNALLRPDKPEQTDKTNKTMLRAGIADKAIVYGRAELSGPIIFAGGERADQDKRNPGALSVIVALTGHPVEEITSIVLGSTTFNFSRGINPTTHRPTLLEFTDNTRLYGVTGQDPDSAEALALRNAIGPDWMGDGVTDAALSTSKLNDIAYVAYIINPDPEVWPGIPNMKARVKGKLIRDPVEMYNLQQAASDPMTAPKAYSDNWAACVLDYLMDPLLGLGVPVDEIDLLYFRNAAMLSDEQVQIDGRSPVQYTSRYTCNGVLSTGDTPISNMEKLLTAGFGTLSYTQGKYRLYGGEYITPLAATEDVITESDLVGPVKIRATVPRSERFNAVRGTYQAYYEGAEFQTNNDGSFYVEDFPEVVNATYKAADAGSDNYTDSSLDGYIYRDITLPFTNNEQAAQRIAKITLNTARQGILVDLNINIKGIRYTVGDNVKIDLPTLALGAETNPGFVEATFGSPVHSSGVITSIPITSGGAGYLYPPEITIGGPGTGASVVAILDQGSIVEMLVLDGGSGYNGSESVTARSPEGLNVAWSDKVFKVQSWSPQEDGTINMSLQEDAASSYDDSANIDSDTQPDILITTSEDDYTPSNLILSSSEVYETTGSGGVWQPALQVNFSPGLDPTKVDYYTVEKGVGSARSYELLSLSSAAVVEDPPSSGNFTALASFVLKDSVSTEPYRLSSSFSAIGEFNFITNTNTAALPEYADALGNHQDFGEEGILY